MNFINSKIALAVLCCALFSCGTPEYLSEKELSIYVSDPDHDLMKLTQTGDVEIKVIYRPTDLLVAQELRAVDHPANEVITKARDKYRHHYYFILKLSKKGKEILSPADQGMNGFSDLLQTISFRLAEKVNLTTSGKDTIQVADYIYNRTFGMGTSTDVLLVFDKSKAEGKELVNLNLSEFGLGTGNQSFQFHVDDLNDAPKIYKP